jgi:hypothetical protein
VSQLGMGVSSLTTPTPRREWRWKVSLVSSRGGGRSEMMRLVVVGDDNGGGVNGWFGSRVKASKISRSPGEISSLETFAFEGDNRGDAGDNGEVRS